MSIIISKDGNKAVRVEKSTIEKENYLQEYIYQNPESIPLYDIKEDIRLLILAREFSTNSGPIDAIGVDQHGDLYIVETKLYKNPDKRTVIAQALDYGAALWKHSGDINEFLSILDQHTQKVFGMRASEKVQEFFQLTDDELTTALDRVRTNLDDGVFHFVVLMDKLDDRLKDLILYVNQNSQFDIYAVELEYYTHDTYEIIIPKIFGAEVKKDVSTTKATSSKVWNWDSFKQRLAEYGTAEVHAAEAILKWAQDNNTEIEWAKSQRGGFFLRFYNKGGKGFYPFVVSGEGRIGWNAPHQGNMSPAPFDTATMRKEIMERCIAIQGAEIDLNNVDGYKGLRIPLGALADSENHRKFFEVCAWIRQTLTA